MLAFTRLSGNARDESPNRRLAKLSGNNAHEVSRTPRRREENMGDLPHPVTCVTVEPDPDPNVEWMIFA